MQSFTDQDMATRVDEKKERKRERERERERETERAVSLGLYGNPIKPMHRTCSAHEGTGLPLKEVLNAWART